MGKGKPEAEFEIKIKFKPFGGLARLIAKAELKSGGKKIKEIEIPLGTEPDDMLHGSINRYVAGEKFEQIVMELSGYMDKLMGWRA